MHRALSIPEVIRIVMEYLHPYPIYEDITKKTSRVRKFTLLNAALTCSSFSGPALDVLWHCMHDLLPLFYLLPNFEYSLNKKMPSNIWGRVQEEHISIFNAYSTRIRHYEPRFVNNIDLSAYLHIVQCCGRTCLLPNLVHFEPFKLSAQEVLFLLCPRLEELSIICKKPANPSVLLNSLQSLSPNLIDVTLQYVVLDDHCLSALCMLTRLETVRVRDAASGATPVTLDFLLNMSARHTLRCLELSGYDLEIVPSLKPPINQRDTIIFEALKHLEIYCDLVVTSLTVLLPHTTFPVLEVFRIGFQNTVLRPRRLGLKEHWYQLFNTISNATTEDLKGLQFACDSHDSAELPLFGILKPGTLSLTSFIVNGPFLRLDHHDMEAIIHTWPLLTTLSLPQRHESSPKLDFSVLITIARGLPHLRRLDISIDATVLPYTPSLSHGMRTLVLLNLHVKNTYRFAECLDRLFPNLEEWEFIGDSDDEATWADMALINQRSFRRM